VVGVQPCLSSSPCLTGAADGLTDASVSIETDTDLYEGWVSVKVCVSGRRQLTEVERNHIVAERNREKRLRDHMGAFRG
jgi:hypothetical protein